MAFPHSPPTRHSTRMCPPSAAGGKTWGQSASRALSVLLQPSSIGEPRDASMCAEFAFVR